MFALSATHYHHEEAAYVFVEKWLWTNGPVCPRCGGVERIGKLDGMSTRLGTYKCYRCRKPFTVKIGTIFEGSRVAMHIWLQAIYLTAGNREDISSAKLYPILGVTFRTASFMALRIRKAIRPIDLIPFGSVEATVDFDHTFIDHVKIETLESENSTCGYRNMRVNQESVDVSGLNLTEADVAFCRAMSSVARHRQHWMQGEEDQEIRP